MRKILVIAGREYNAAVRAKSFLISLILLPILMGGGGLMTYLLKGQVDITEKRFAIIDRTQGAQIYPLLARELETRNTKWIFDPNGKQIKPLLRIEKVEPLGSSLEQLEQQRFEQSERVRRGELFGFLEIGSDIVRPIEDRSGQAGAADSDGRMARIDAAQEAERAFPNRVVRYQSSSPNYDEFYKLAEEVISREVQAIRFKGAGSNIETAKALLKHVPLAPKGLSRRDEVTGAIVEAKDENPLVGILVPGGLMMLMFMMIFVGATPAMQGVVEEKMQRIAEVLLGSVTPFQMMMGKLLGLMGVSLTLAAVYLTGGYIALQQAGFADYISAELIVWFLLFQMFGVLMFGSLFIAVGAACTDLRETQNMLWPVMLLAMMPLFVWVNVVREPTSNFAVGVSLFPFATPMLMLARMAIPPGIPYWQPIVGLAGVLVATLFCVYVAGRIFRLGILMQGKGAKLSDMVRWVIKG